MAEREAAGAEHQLRPCSFAVSRERRAAVEPVADYGVSEPAGVGGVDTDLVRAACEGLEDDINTSVRQESQYFVLRDSRLAGSRIDHLPGPVVVVQHQGQGDGALERVVPGASLQPGPVVLLDLARGKLRLTSKSMCLSVDIL